MWQELRGDRLKLQEGLFECYGLADRQTVGSRRDYCFQDVVVKEGQYFQ